MKEFKRKFLRFIGPASWFFLGLLIGITLVILVYCCNKSHIKLNDFYDPWLISYYIFSMIGALGTVLAVIVALAKESIMRWLYSPRLEVFPVDNGLMEILNDSVRVPEATSYECHITIENTGSMVALGCRVYISDIKYSKSAKKECKTIKNVKNKQLLWMSNGVDIPVGISNRIKLFEVINPDLQGTPQTDSNNHPPQIKFNGCSLGSKYSQGGYWFIDYYVSCKNGKVMKFCMSIEWNGEFKSRATDMSEVLKIQIEKK